MKEQKSQPDPWVNVTKERMPMGKEEKKGKTDEREGEKREQDRTGEGEGGCPCALGIEL